jgi:hypothetical protein
MSRAEEDQAMAKSHPSSNSLAALVVLAAAAAVVAAAAPAAATVTLTVDRPLDGDTVVSPVEVRAEATTDAAGAHVTGWQVFADGVTAYGTAGPASSMATRLTLDNGSHEIVVTAQDSSGDSATATFTIAIGVCSGFTVTLDSPAGGSETAPVHFAASAASCHRITGFALYSDDREIFQQRGGRSVDTTIDVPAGNHTIFARAWDTTGAYANSSAVPVEVAPKPAPQPAPARKPPAAQAPATQTPPQTPPP